MPTPLRTFIAERRRGFWRGTTPQGGPGKKQLGNAFLRSGRNYTRVTSLRLATHLQVNRSLGFCLEIQV